MGPRGRAARAAVASVDETQRSSVHERNAPAVSPVYAVAGPAGNPVHRLIGGGAFVQTAQPRDVGALALVVGLFLILFVVSLMYGSPVS
jgi:hypothetical protein